MADPESHTYELRPIGVVRSLLRSPREAPRQAFEGAPPARVEILPEFRQALDGIAAGDVVVVLTWLHQASRDVRHVRPAAISACRSRACFATRSPGRRNPIGLHRVTVTGIDDGALEVCALEAIDGTPVVDIKPVMSESADG